MSTAAAADTKCLLAEGECHRGGDVQTGLFHRVQKLERAFQAETQCLQSPRLGIRDEEAQGRQEDCSFRGSGMLLESSLVGVGLGAKSNVSIAGSLTTASPEAEPETRILEGVSAGEGQ